MTRSRSLLPGMLGQVPIQIPDIPEVLAWPAGGAIMAVFAPCLDRGPRAVQHATKVVFPLTKVKLINELNEREARLGVKEGVSWHQDYKDSAWIFMGGLPYELTEGDIICVFSQYGEVVNINLVRDKQSGRSRGFCFLCYEDQRSTVLAVDNLNGIKLKGRTVRVDHVSNYRAPKDADDIDEVTKTLREKGCAAQTPPHSSSEEEPGEPQKIKKHKKKKRKKESRDSSSERSARIAETIKEERADPGYEKYNNKPSTSRQDRDQRKASDKERSSGSAAKQPSHDRHKAEEKRHASESKHRDHEEKRAKEPKRKDR
ncbi:PREDICTED: RNA-binding motif protein, X-linked 2 [Nanorana parkeri]|uniref:RNA-binding motif protein, X-linked 2 n=1 Tax=Nanorana parkeri TaxID=125878 RepID=UPI0008546E56|nr:PREDICTED: RNA-binding motif protein, X-linked 2 [Nanorana parkeri]